MGHAADGALQASFPAPVCVDVCISLANFAGSSPHVASELRVCTGYGKPNECTCSESIVQSI
jgi:hypothetical protein